MGEPQHTPPSDPADLELVRSPGDSAEPPPRRGALWGLVTVAVLVSAAIAPYFLFGRRETAPPAAPPAASGDERREPPPAETPLGGEPAAVTVPPLDESDPVVRELLKQLTAHPRLAAWLATDGLLRNFTVVVENVAAGATPAARLRSLRPTAGFQVVTRGGITQIDPRSYQRYDGLAAAVASIDPADAARVYATLKPRIEEAYRDVSDPNVRFDRTLERAIVLLLETPVVADPIQVREQGGTGYAFVDPALEDLAPAQKQLLRTGAANVRAFQSSLRAMALALGIPASRLPAPRS